MPRQFQRLLLLDPELGCKAGHYQNYADTLRQACADASLSMSAAGGPGSPRPVFDRMNAAFIPRWMAGALLNPFIGEFRMHRQLRRGATSLVDSGTLAFAATANHRSYAALARWVEEIPPDRAPALAILLRFSDYDARRGRWKATAPLARRGLRRLERVAGRRTVRLLTDSESLAEEYRGMTRLPVVPLRIPYMLPPGRALSRPPSAAVRVGFFGEARLEKGFAVLLDALDILARSGHGQRIEVVVQTSSRPGGEGHVHAARRRLCDGRFAALRLIEQNLPAEQYQAEFLACDVILLPYLWQHYRSRNSGIFADAVAAGLPVIVTRGTWMEEQLSRHGAGLVAPSGDAAALAAAIVEFMVRRDELRSRAAEAGGRWRAEHAPGRFLSELISLCE